MSSRRALSVRRPAPGGRPLAQPRRTAAAAALTLLLAASSVLAVPIQFPGQLSVPVFGQASAVAGWDIESDGRSELIVGSETGLLALVRDFGRGRYEATEPFAVGGRVSGLLVAEPVPGEGARLLVLTRDPDRLLFLSLAAAVPAFAILSEIPLEEDPEDLVVGPHGLAGGPAIAIALPGIDSWILLEPGPQGWRQVAEIPAGDRPARIAAVDLDQDGVAELVTVDRGLLSRGLSVFARDGSGWGLRQQYAARGEPSDVAVWDEDGDGRSELFVSHADSAVVAVLAGEGGLLVERRALPLPGGTDGLVVGEVMAGQQGLLAWSAARGTVHYLHRGLQGWTYQETFYGGGEALAGVLVEINGDSARDLALANGRAGSAGLLFGNRAPSFRAYLAEDLPALPSAALLRDEDGDGHLDLMVACAGSLTIERLLGDGQGRLRRTQLGFPLEGAPQGLVGLDADEDGLQDLALLEQVADRLRILRRVPGGGYENLATVPTGDGPVALAAADLDRDGHQDLVVGSQLQVQFTVAFGDGSGGFEDVRVFQLWLASLADLVVVDIGGDLAPGGGPLPDLVASSGATGVQTLMNLGNRDFGRASQVNVRGGPSALAAGDLDEDGDLDVAVGLNEDRAIALLENRGLGSLTLRAERVGLASIPGKLAIGQMDLVGGPDLVFALPQQQSIGISLRGAPWLFSPPLTLASALEPAGLAIADLNEDGVPDLATIDRTLGLALSMLNIDPDPVPVAPAALIAEAGAATIRLLVRPGEAASWRLEGRGRTGWRLLAETGTAVHGEADSAPDRWTLLLSRAALEAAGLAADAAGAWSFRLLGGAGEMLAEASAGLPPTADSPAALLSVGSARPNPFNPSVSLSVRLARSTVLEAVVWDLAGRRVATVAAGWHAAGEHVLNWDGRRHDGRPAPTGEYLLTVGAAGQRQTRKLILTK